MATILATTSLPLTGSGGPVLAGGARLAASSSPLPQRITGEADYLIDTTAAGGAIQSIDFWSSATYGLVVLAVINGRVKGYQLDGTVVVDGAAANGKCIFKVSSDLYWISRNTASASYWELDLNAGTINAKTIPSTSRRQVWPVSGGTAGKAWQVSTGTTLEEFTVATGAATGRSITAAGAINCAYPGTLGGVPSIFVLTSGLVTQYKESDLSTVRTFAASGASGLPGSNVGTTMVIDPTGLPVVWSVDGNFDRLSTAATNQGGVADRYLWSGPAQRGPGQVTSGGGAQQQGGLAWSTDGRYMAFLSSSLDGANDNRVIRVVNIQAQTAAWSYTVEYSGTFKGLQVAGAMGLLYGVTDGWRAGTTIDHRRLTWSYQRTGTGTTDPSPVAFEPNATLAVPITAGQTLVVTGTFTPALLRPYEPTAYLTELELLYSYEAAEDDQSVPVDPATATTLDVIRAAQLAALRAITPRVLADLQFDYLDEIDLAAWAAAGAPGSEIFRKVLWERAGTSDVEGVQDAFLRQVEETVSLQVFYPELLELYGRERYGSMESVIRSDARQVRDALYATRNYVTGQVFCLVEIGALQRTSEGAWVQPFVLTIRYWEAQSLYLTAS